MRKLKLPIWIKAWNAGGLRYQLAVLMYVSLHLASLSKPRDFPVHLLGSIEGELRVVSR